MILLGETSKNSVVTLSCGVSPQWASAGRQRAKWAAPTADEARLRVRRRHRSAKSVGASLRVNEPRCECYSSSASP